jgi:hypothetical protein
MTEMPSTNKIFTELWRKRAMKKMKSDYTEEIVVTQTNEGGKQEGMVELTPNLINLLTNPTVMVSGRPDTIQEHVSGSESVSNPDSEEAEMGEMSNSPVTQVQDPHAAPAANSCIMVVGMG